MVKIMRLKSFFFSFLLMFFMIGSVLAEVNLTGAGATFPAPVYIKWADKYQKETGNKINYQSIGSSAGIKQVLLNTVDFGASDIALDELKIKKEQLFQFPTLISGIVPVVNIPNIKCGELILNSEILCDIYFGNIKKWNDKKILKLNPSLNIPNKDIVVIHRADGSGTTFVFTQYLSMVNSNWKNRIGFGSTVNWPIGIGAKGNEGVATFVQRIPGSISYIEYAYIKQSKLSYVKLISSKGEIVDPHKSDFRLVFKKFNFYKDLTKNLINQKGDGVWPIMATTFIILNCKKMNNIENLKSSFDFFDWAYKNGSYEAFSLGYFMLPDKIIQDIKVRWAKKIETFYFR